MNRTYLYILSTCIGAAVCSCSHTETSQKQSVETSAPEKIESLVHAPASVLDSLALNADDLTPQQAVNLLMGYVELQRSTTSTRAKVVTMRKFVDVYDIVMNNYGDKFRAQIRDAAGKDNINLKEVSLEYREKLSGYDEASGIIIEPAAPKDSTAAVEDSASVSEPAADGI